MPNYKCHLAGGIFAYGVALIAVILFILPSWATLCEWLLCALAGALFPDVDIKSKGQRLFYWVILALLLVLFVYRRLHMIAFMSIMAVIPMLVKHRGLFHRTWFVIFVPTVLGWFLCWQLPKCMMIIFFDILFFIVGALSHLWLDLGVRRMLRP